MDEGPFDIGNTCRGGIYTIENYKTEISEFTKETNEKPEFLDQMFAAIYNRNKSSLANGSLMRISPQAFFFSLTGESPLQHAQFIQSTSSSTQMKSGSPIRMRSSETPVFFGFNC